MISFIYKHAKCISSDYIYLILYYFYISHYRLPFIISNMVLGVYCKHDLLYHILPNL